MIVHPLNGSRAEDDLINAVRNVRGYLFHSPQIDGSDYWFHFRTTMYKFHRVAAAN